MEAGVRKRDQGRARRGHTKPDKQVGLGKRRHSAEDENGDATEHTRKSPRIQESFYKRNHNRAGKVRSQPSRKSPRIQEIRDLNQQRIAQAGKRTRLSPRTTKAYHYTGQEQPQVKRGFPRSAKKSEQRRFFEDQEEGKAKSSPGNQEAQKCVKRRRSTENGDLSNRDAKRPQRHNIQQQVRPRPGRGKDEFVKSWLGTSCWSRGSSANNETLLEEAPDNMPRKITEVLPSPDDSVNSTISSSRKSERSTASVHDADYHHSLRYRDIYIEREDPPMELMRRAERIISRPRASPEMDDATIQKLRGKSRKLRNEAEDVIIKQLAPHIIPAMDEIPDQRLAMNADQPWFNSIPVPLDPSILTNPLPLPRPKPDLAFGYSETAFTRNQLGTIDLLIDDQFGRSYAIPDQKLRFPFLDIEFKSQAKNGTHYIATNQVAGAGAIILNGHLELIQRSFGTRNFDFDEPQFFSVTMDHQLACVNVHWLSAPAEGGQCSFHVEGLSQHLLKDANGLRAAVRAIKNILDYGSDARLRRLCEALDTYRETVIAEREAITKQRDKRHKANSQPDQRRESKRGQQPPYDQQGYQSPGAQQPSCEQWGFESRPNLPANEGATVHAGEDWAHKSEESLQAERRRHDAPLPPSTHSRHAADKPRTELRQGLRRQSQRLQDQRLITEVPSEQMVHKGKTGQRIRYNSGTVFVARDRWTAFSRNGRDGLYCAELDVYTYLT